jgi:hypothetical protein
MPIQRRMNSLSREIDQCNHTVKSLHSRVLEKVGSSSCTTKSKETNHYSAFIARPSKFVLTYLSKEHIYEIAEKSPQQHFEYNMTMSAAE